MTEHDNRWSGVIGPHGGYRNLKSYQNAEIIEAPRSGGEASTR